MKPKLKIFKTFKKKNSISISFWLCKQINVSNKTESKHDDLLSIGVENKKHYILIKDFKNLYMIIHCIVEENAFFRYCLQTFSTEKKNKCHVIYCFKINGKKDD